MGAWIETAEQPFFRPKLVVVPRVGAWIETELPFVTEAQLMSHPVWVRGLKPAM